MKFLFCFTIAIAFVAVHAGKIDPAKIKEFMDNMKACGESLSIDMSSLETDGFSALKKIMEDNKEKCLSKCIMEKYGVIDESGNFVSEKAEELLQSKSVDMEKVKECFENNKVKDNADADEECKQYGKIDMCLMKLRH